MIAHELKNLRRILTSGASGRLQLLVLLLLAVLHGTLTLMKGPSQHPLTPFLSAVGFFFWFMMGSGCLLTAHHAYQLRLAGMSRQVARALLVMYVLLTLLPALLRTSIVGALATNTAVAAVILLAMMLPAHWLVLLAFIPVLLSPQFGLTQHLPIDSANPYTYWIITLPLVTIAWLRWLSMRKIELNNAQRGATLLTAMRSGANINFSFSTSSQPGWVSPRIKRGGTVSPLARLRSLLGMLFAPGAWLRQGLFNLMVCGGILLATEQARNTTADPTGYVNAFFNSGFLMAIIATATLSLIFPARLLFRRESHDLAEIALLPGLPSTHKVRQMTRAALYAAGLLGFGIATSLALLNAVFHQMSLVKLLAMTGSVALSAFLCATQLLNVATHPQPRHPVVRSLLWMFAAIPGLLAWYFAINGLLAHRAISTLISMIALLAWLGVVAGLHTRWRNMVASRPHPYVQP